MRRSKRTNAIDTVNRRTAKVLVLISASWLLVACSFLRNGREIMVTRDQAIEVAKKEFSKHGRAVSDYDITVDPDNTTDDYWMIWFDRKGPFPTPGSKHAVRVNKSTGHAEFMPGQ